MKEQSTLREIIEYTKHATNITARGIYHGYVLNYTNLIRGKKIDIDIVMVMGYTKEEGEVKPKWIYGIEGRYFGKRIDYNPNDTSQKEQERIERLFTRLDKRRVKEYRAQQGNK